MKRFYSCIVFLLLFLFLVQNKAFTQNITVKTPRQQWVDSVMTYLPIDEQIAQLMMIRSFSGKDPEYANSIATLLKKWGIGGVCFFKGNPQNQVNAINLYNSVSRIPILVSIDGEWGVAMRLDSTTIFPRQMTMGAIREDSLIYAFGSKVADQCKMLGIHINFVPDVDVNSNPANPVINTRSFGENRENVARKGWMYAKAMQDKGLLTSAKHFPGHGDTDTDSHLSLPVINHDRKRLDSIDLYPFKYMIEKGVKGVMVGHLHVPAIDSTKNFPSSISPLIIDSLLRNELGFQGLVYTDALEMKGITKYYKAGEIELRALMAGCDILLLPEDVALAIRYIRNAVDSNRIACEVIEAKCRKVIEAKYDLGLSNKTILSPVNVSEVLLSPESEALNNTLYESSLVLLKNSGNIVPFNMNHKHKIACVVVGDTSKTDFQLMIDKYAEVKHFNLPSAIDSLLADSVLSQLSEYDFGIVSVLGTNGSSGKMFGITPSEVDFVSRVRNSFQESVFALFASPYALGVFKELYRYDGVILACQDRPEARKAMAQALFGGNKTDGILPVNVSSDFVMGQSEISPKTCLSFRMPEQVGISSATLAKVDSIAIFGIRQKAYPGCQILVAKDGALIYQKSFGSHQYDSLRLVNNQDLYDLASVTKVMATTLAVMKLVDKGKIDLDRKLSHYLSFLRRTNKKNITIREVLAHQAGLQPWIPFYKKTLRNGKPDSTLYSHDSSDYFPVRVADSLFLKEDYPQKIWKEIAESELLPSKEYKYSDLGFFLMKALVEKVSKKTLDQYVKENFYQPLSLKTTCFKPLNTFERDRIVPTEYDTAFRDQLIHGYVHDPGAAMLGGVCGHAGLFSNARDLAVLLQLLLNGGEYGGTRYLKQETIDEFTAVQYPQNGNRRGLGFDKPLLIPVEDGPVCIGASAKSFGHSGFTGTYVWADPSNNLIYIFLSNRVNPSATNTKLSDLNIRTRIHQLFYEK